MASVTLQGLSFPVGTVLGAHRNPAGPEAGEPIGPLEATGTVVIDNFRNKVTFTGLQGGARYAAAAEVDGAWRRVSFVADDA